MEGVQLRVRMLHNCPNWFKFGGSLTVQSDRQDCHRPSTGAKPRTLRTRVVLSRVMVPPSVANVWATLNAGGTLVVTTRTRGTGNGNAMLCCIVWLVWCGRLPD